MPTALGLGVFLSLFADTEFQAIQFISVVISPQVILGGTFLPVSALPVYLEYPALVMPITHLIDAMEYVVRDVGTIGDFAIAVGALAAFAILAVAVSSIAIRRAG